MNLGANITENVSSLLSRIPETTFKFVKAEMVGFGNRFRARMVNERMKGRPGIDAPKLSKGKNLSAWTSGGSIKNLTTTARITRILVTHETGATIKPTHGQYLYLRGKWLSGSKWNAGTESASDITAKARRVVIPARLGFRALWQGMVPGERARIKAATTSALKTATTQSVKQSLNIS